MLGYPAKAKLRNRMGRRRHRHEDPELHEFLENYRRAGGTLVLALAMLVGWALCAVLAAGGVGAASGAAPVPALFATVLGYGGMLLLAVAALLYAYAYIYPHLMARIDR
jgi:hypothetical protein